MSSNLVYRHLFFDLDHTLWDFDSNSRLALQEVYEEKQVTNKTGATFEAFFEKYLMHNKLLWERYQKGFISAEELKWRRMWRTLMEFRLADEELSKAMGYRFLEILPTKTQLFPHTKEILQYLKERNYKLHLITNGFEKTQWNKLRHGNIDHYFSEVITSETSQSTKPDKAIFEYAINKAKATLSESIMIGDNLEADIKGSLGAGMDAVFVNHINDNTPTEATYTVRHLKELETIFR
jgi:putative hydrolase of the HAD superfamily